MGELSFEFASCCSCLCLACPRLSEEHENSVAASWPPIVEATWPGSLTPDCCFRSTLSQFIRFLSQINSKKWKGAWRYPCLLEVPETISAHHWTWPGWRNRSPLRFHLRIEIVAKPARYPETRRAETFVALKWNCVIVAKSFVQKC